MKLVGGNEVAEGEETGKAMGSRKRKEGIPKTKNVGQGEKEIKLEITEEERKVKKEGEKENGV